VADLRSAADSIVDVHCHAVPPATRARLLATDGVEVSADGLRASARLLPLPPKLSDRDAFAAHVGALAGAAVAPPPALYLEDHPQLAAPINADLAAFTADFPTVRTLAWLPLSDPDAALAEIARAAALPGVVGVVIGSALGPAIGGAAYDGVWPALAAADLSVFLHPDSDPFAAAFRPLTNPSTVGFPAATTAVILALLTGETGLWDAGVRLCLSHGGGFLAGALGRVLRSDPAGADRIRARLSQVWVDSVVFGPSLLDLVTATFGERVLPGSDWPFPLSLSAADLAQQPPLGDAAAWCPRLAAAVRQPPTQPSSPGDSK
jgi:aminocarboxymuconate-semialdehyde decarboxylase